MIDEVFLNQDECIEIAFVGDQTTDELMYTIAKTREIIDELKTHGKPALILVDVTKAGKSSPGARQKVVSAVKEVPYDRIAAYGANTFHKTVGNLIIHAVGKQAVIKHFTERTEAVKWLKET